MTDTNAKMLRDVEATRRKLVARAAKSGIYEDFGQREIRTLRDRYGYTPEIRKLDEWASTYSPARVRGF